MHGNLAGVPTVLHHVLRLLTTTFSFVHWLFRQAPGEAKADLCAVVEKAAQWKELLPLPQRHQMKHPP